MLVFFTFLSLMEFQVRYLALLLLFSVIDGFKWFWMESLHKNNQLILEFLKGPFLVLHFSCYTLMAFLMMISVILLSMRMILLSILSVIRQLICGNNLKWLLNLNLIYETLWTVVRSDLLISMLRKTQLVSLDRSNNNCSIEVEMNVSVLEERSCFKMLRLTISIAKLPPRKLKLYFLL